MIKIKIWGEIQLQTSSVVETALSNITDKDEPILILINSPGGHLSEAIAICNLLKAVPNPIITVTFGYCASAAVMIFLCGDYRYVSQDIIFMVHQPYSIYDGLVQNYTEAQKNTASLKRSMNIYKKYITNNTNIPKEKIDEVFVKGKDLYFSNKECIKYKIATNQFTNWLDLYNKQKIKTDEEILLYEVVVQKAEEI